jgi:hypothetical protein
MKLRIVCWWLALAAFAGIGLFRWTQYFVPAPPRFHERDAALDAMARQHFGLEHGAAALRRELAGLAPDGPVLVLGPGDDWTLSEAHFLISYLALPRPVWCVGLVPAGRKAQFDHPPPPGLQAAGLFFYKTAAPVDVPVHKLSERLSLARVLP